MVDQLGFGIIASGEITKKATAPGIAGASNARIVMAMDTREELAKDIAEEYDAAWTTDTDELLANPDVEAVYIAAPHFLHTSLTIQALEAGKHVLVEKPIATTVADADAMIAKAKETGLKLSVAFAAQYDHTMVRLASMIAGGLLGKVTGTRIVYRGDKAASYWHGGFTQRVQTDWRTRRKTAGGGVLIMNTVHDINTIRYLTGLEAQRIFCEYDNYVTPVEVEDYITLIVRYDNGAIGTLEAGSALPGRDPNRPVNRIYGERGQIILTAPPQIYLREVWGDVPADEWYPLPIDEQVAKGRAAMIEQFVRAIREDVDPPVTGWDGRQALNLIMAAYRSGQTHQPVTLAD